MTRPAPGPAGARAARGERAAPASASSPGRGRAGERLLLAALVVAALAARCWAPWDAVFGRLGEPRLLGTDAYFHLRHAHAAVADFPHLERRDLGTHYPEGTANDAAGLFDLAVAAVARTLHGPGATRDEVAAIAACFPPLLGAATVALLWALARRVAPRPAPLVASLLFVLYPGESLGRTALGFADHHAAESLLTVAAVLGAVVLLQRDRHRAFPWWRPASAAAAPMAALAFTWRGAPLVLLVLAFGVALERLATLGTGAQGDGTPEVWPPAPGSRLPSSAPSRPGEERLAALARPVVRYGLGLLAPLLAVRWLRPELELGAPSAGLMLGGAAALTLGGGLGLAFLELAARRSGRPATVAWTGLVVALAAAWLVLDATEPGRQAWAWLAAPRTALVQEHRPVTAGLFLGQLGAVALLAVPGLVLGVIQAVRRALPREALVPLGVGAALLAVWRSTRDLGYAPPPFLALAAALPVVAVWQWVQTGRAGTQPGPAAWARRAAAVALGAVLAAPLWPYRVARTPWMRAAEVAEVRVYPEPLFAAMDWLRGHTPPGGRSRSAAPATYGVQSSWPIGNVVAAYGERVPVWSRYPSPDYPRWALARSEEEAAPWLCPRCGPGDGVRYVVVDARDCGQWLLAAAAQYPEPLPLLVRTAGEDASGAPPIVPGPAYEESLVVRLCADDARGLGGYRLVWESSERSLSGVLVARAAPPEDRAFARLVTRPWAAVDPPEAQPPAGAVATPDGVVRGARTHAAVKVFEVVPGARLVGTAPPGAWVTATLPLVVESSGRRWEHAVTTAASAGGAFELVVPYPTDREPGRSAVRPSGPYRLTARDGAGVELRGEATVAASEVRRGARVPVRLGGGL